VPDVGNSVQWVILLTGTEGGASEDRHAARGQVVLSAPAGSPAARSMVGRKDMGGGSFQ
jgi:hypothetical protein